MFKDRLCEPKTLTRLRRACIKFFTVTIKQTSLILHISSRLQEIWNFLFIFIWYALSETVLFSPNCKEIFFCFDTIDGRSFPTGTLVYELTLTNKVMSYSRDDPKHFELLWMLLFLYIPIFCHCQFHFSEQRWTN